MKKTIHFVRHAEASHNRDARLFKDFYEGKHLSEEYVDSKLSEEGIKQCEQLKNVLSERVPDPDLIISSSLSRAIQTARISYPDSEILVTDRCIERRANNISDKRSNISHLKTVFDKVNFDDIDVGHDEYHLFDLDKEVEPSPFSSNKCIKRAKEFIDYLFSRPELNIIVFTHSVFLYHIVKAEGLSKNLKFKNAQLTTLTFERSL
jgi:broad specificity phosphatase PhoE